MTNVFPAFVLSKGEHGMSRPTSFDHVCVPLAMMAFHTGVYSIECATEGPCRHFMANVIQLFVLSKRDDNMPR